MEDVTEGCDVLQADVSPGGSIRPWLAALFRRRLSPQVLLNAAYRWFQGSDGLAALMVRGNGSRAAWLELRNRTSAFPYS